MTKKIASGQAKGVGAGYSVPAERSWNDVARKVRDERVGGQPYTLASRKISREMVVLKKGM